MAKKIYPELPSNKDHTFYMRCRRALARGLPLPDFAQYLAERAERLAAIPADPDASPRVRRRRQPPRTSGIKASPHSRPSAAKYIEAFGMSYASGSMTPRRSGGF